MDAVELALPVLIALITVALAFDFLNGLHDAANSIATIVSTRVLRPQYAVIWAAFFNFVAFLIFGAHVAETVGTGILAADIVDPRVVFGALTGAIAWNIITWALGIPSSSSHALIGGLVGAGVAKVGIKAIWSMQSLGCWSDCGDDARRASVELWASGRGRTSPLLGGTRDHEELTKAGRYHFHASAMLLPHARRGRGSGGAA